MTDLHGLLVLDKPTGITSRAAVDQAALWFPKKTKIGHTGTLDPLATGALVLCLGKATRLAEFVQDMHKTYAATIRLGARSDTDDADGTIAPTPSAAPIDEATIRETMNSFIGKIEQAPPAYSAIKVSGKRAHALARKGRPPDLQPRSVHVYAIDLIDYAWPDLRLKIHCGKGTYIRSLARDLGEKLGVGAYVAQLRRTRVGPFEAEEGCTLAASISEVRSKIRPIADAVQSLPRVIIAENQLIAFASGQEVYCESPLQESATPEQAVYLHSGELVGVGLREGQLVRPWKNLRHRN